MSATIEPVKDGLGNTGYRVSRIVPDFTLAQIGAAALDELCLADLTPPAVTPPEPAPVVYPPNCDEDARYGQESTQSGQAAEILIELTEGDE